MYIGFDAKRVFLNGTGLGNYGRTLLSAMAGCFPGQTYYLFTPRTSPLFNVEYGKMLKIVRPDRFPGNVFPAIWRSKLMVRETSRMKLDIYHGLSNELPFGIHRFPVKTVVTVHDLIFERFPHQYSPIDAYIYRTKTLYACRHAHRIVAVSEQTRQDLIDYYHVDPAKIKVVYQSSDPVYSLPVAPEKIECIAGKYGLPGRFILSVGSVIERKNLLTLVRAMRLWKECPPLVVIGSGSEYKKRVKQYLQEHNMTGRVIWLSERRPVLQADMPAIYRMADALVYPSVFEGFGIPIQEALWSGTPVIASDGSCFRETGGDAVLYIDPFNAHLLADAMHSVCTDHTLATEMGEKGRSYVRPFTARSTATRMMDIYEELTLSQPCHQPAHKEPVIFAGPCPSFPASSPGTPVADGLPHPGVLVPPA